MSEILEEVSKLSTEERHILFERLNEMEVGDIDETPEMLAAILKPGKSRKRRMSQPKNFVATW